MLQGCPADPATCWLACTCRASGSRGASAGSSYGYSGRWRASCPVDPAQKQSRANSSRGWAAGTQDRQRQSTALLASSTTACSHLGEGDGDDADVARRLNGVQPLLLQHTWLAESKHQAGKPLMPGAAHWQARQTGTAPAAQPSVHSQLGGLHTCQPAPRCLSKCNSVHRTSQPPTSTKQPAPTLGSHLSVSSTLLMAVFWCSPAMRRFMISAAGTNR